MKTRNEPVGSRRYRSRLKPFGGMPDMTALVTVFFLALMFFLLSSSFVQVSGIHVDLPQVENQGFADIEKFVLSVAMDPSGKPRFYFNDQPVNWEQMKEKFAEVRLVSRTATVVVRAERETPLEVYAQVAALAEKAQLATFLVTASQKTRPETSFGSR